MSSSLEIILTSVRLSLTTEIISTSVGMIKGYMKLLEKKNKSILSPNGGDELSGYCVYF